MEKADNNGRQRQEMVSLPQTQTPIMLQSPQEAESPVEGNTSGYFLEQTRPPLIYWLLFVLSFGLFVAGIVFWLWVHQLLEEDIWNQTQPFPKFDFVSDGPIGIIVETIAWVNLAVQLRWMRFLASARAYNEFRSPNVILTWVFDGVSTPLTTLIILIFVQNFSISFTQGARVSLAETEPIAFGAIAFILGMSVPETRALLSRISNKLFDWLRNDNQSGNQEEAPTP